MRAQTLVVMGFSLVTGACDQSEVQVRFHPRAPVTAAMLRLRINAAGEVWEFTGPDTGRFETRRIQTRETGSLTVTFRLQSHTGDSIGGGSVTVPIRSDWIWGFDIFTETQDPRLQCFGCAGSISFPLDSAYHSANADRLWVAWGGNSIKNPVIY